MALEGLSVDEVQALAEVAQRMSNDPRTRPAFLRNAKVLNPEAAIPEVDIPHMLAQQFAEPLKELDALKKRQAERDLQDRIREQRQGIPASEVAAVEKIMVDEGIVNHQTAYKHLEMSRKAAEPTPASTLPGVRRYEKPTLPDGLKAVGDLKDFSFKAAYGVIDQLRGRKAAA